MNSFKKTLLFLSFILVFTLLVACSSDKSSNDQSSDSYVSEDEDLSDYEMAENEDIEDEEAGSSPLEPEKVITSIYMNFETTNFDKATKDLKSLISKYEAYIESSEISYNRHSNNKNYKSGFFVIRVPQDKLSKFKSELDGVGNMVNESTQKEDVTREYRDSESRLRVIETKEKRILELLEKAEEIEDIIKLEEQLHEIIYEKEIIKANLKYIDDQIDFTRVEININEVEKLTTPTSLETSFGTRLLNAVKDSLYFFQKIIGEFIILLLYALPFLIVIGIPAFLIIRFFRRS